MHDFTMGFGGLIIFIGVLAFVYLAAQRGAGGASGKSAQDILDERYARGEIDEEEYKRKSNTLRQNRQ